MPLPQSYHTHKWDRCCEPAGRDRMTRIHFLRGRRDPFVGDRRGWTGRVALLERILFERPVVSINHPSVSGMALVSPSPSVIPTAASPHWTARSTQTLACSRVRS
jgi:hypothetical protein